MADKKFADKKAKDVNPREKTSPDSNLPPNDPVVDAENVQAAPDSSAIQEPGAPIFNVPEGMKEVKEDGKVVSFKDPDADKRQKKIDKRGKGKALFSDVEEIKRILRAALNLPVGVLDPYDGVDEDDDEADENRMVSGEMKDANK